MKRMNFIMVVCSICLLLWEGNSLGEGIASDIRPKEIQINLMGNPYGSLYFIGAEIAAGRQGSITGRVGGLSYDYEEDSYWEGGSGTLLGIGGKFYVNELMKGMYFGGGIDYVSASIDWEEGGYYGYSYGTTEVSGLAPSISLGYKAVFNDKTVLEPNLLFAFLTGAGDIQTDTIIGLGIALGIRF